MITATGRPRAVRRARLLQSVAWHQRLSRYRAKEAQDRAPAGLRVAQKSSDKELILDRLSLRVRRACRYIPMYARPPYNDVKIHAAPGRSAGHIRACTGRENPPDASFAACARLSLLALQLL